MHANLLCWWLVFAFLVFAWLRASFPLVPRVIFDVCQPAILLLLAVCLTGGL